ncbi:hypothetical protein CUJ89_22595 [Burkholderia pyrrocinia]|uniref:Uncharacterized protein n=2 Tax=Burkholderia pyrrocinia TaxID=60550 RepID=A0A2Z5N2R7_BURPY|nr:hypothetical protein CUJ89_22595 [Burkholderia pyrrocinia]
MITLEGGAHQDFIFKALPRDQYKAGTYAFALSAWLYINWKDGDEQQRSHADFFSGKDNRSTIKMDHDYPSTPQEREQWEATHRASMSSQPVKPGETFAEDGLYRAVRTNSSNHRSLQLVPFKARAVATTDSVKMLMERGNGMSLDGPVQWLWEGSAPTPVKQYSFDTIEETRQFCEPGSACPRSGRWLPRIREGWDRGYRYDLAGIVTVRHGQTMPTVKETGDKADWEWVGV